MGAVVAASVRLAPVCTNTFLADRVPLTTGWLVAAGMVTLTVLVGTTAGFQLPASAQAVLTAPVQVTAVAVKVKVGPL